ncbi:MAG: DUF2267 domain-containing protein [Pseudomonadota bacterium]
MNEAISSLAVRHGIDEAKARKAVGMILAFLKKEGPEEPVSKLMAVFPDADGLLAEAESAGGGGLMGMMGSMGGGLMALGGKLMGIGLNMTQVQNLSRDVFVLGKQYAGDDVMNELVSGVPGLSQFAA